MRLAFAAAVATLALTAATDASAARSFKIVDQIDAPEGAWLFAGVDEAARRLYVGRSDGFLAVDLETRKTTQLPLDGKRVRGVVPVPGTGLVLGVTDKSNTATIIDGATGAVKAEVPVGRQPETASYDPSTGLVSVMAVSADVTLIDAKAGKAVGSIPVQGILESSVADGKGRVYVNLEDKDEVGVIDIPGRKQVASYKLPGCHEPTGIGYDDKTGLLISACKNKVAKLIDAKTGADRGTIEIAGGPDAVLVDSQRRLAYVPCSEGYLVVIDLAGKTPKKIASVVTAQGAHTGALDAKTGKVYVPVGRAPATDFGARAVPGFALLVVAADSK
jgi:YVTN family beta-propeller protein